VCRAAGLGADTVPAAHQEDAGLEGVGLVAGTVPAACPGDPGVDGVGWAACMNPAACSGVVPQSGGLPQEEGSNGRLSRSRDTRYGTRGPGSRADRNAKT